MMSNYFQECLERFSLLPLSTRQLFGSADVAIALRALEKKYAVDLQFVLVLLAINELEVADIPAYLQEKYRVRSKRAETIAQALQTNVIDKIERSLATNQTAAEEPDENKLPSESEERELYEDMFREGLSAVLQTEDKQYLQALNRRIFYLFTKDIDFRDSLLRLLQQNQERVTRGELVLKEKKVPSTVSNWLKDFVAVNGAQYIDTVALSRYLANSKNVTALSADEKKVVRKLLQLYRNLAFFPQSMPNETGEGWEIIPVRAEDAPSGATKKTRVRQQTAPPEAGPDSRKQPPSKQAPQSQSKPKPQQTRNPHVAALKEMASQYPEGSLERRAIEEELKKYGSSPRQSE